MGKCLERDAASRRISKFMLFTRLNAYGKSSTIVTNLLGFYSQQNLIVILTNVTIMFPFCSNPKGVMLPVCAHLRKYVEAFLLLMHPHFERLKKTD